jgi:UDP-glucuronate 4-epimerase
MPGMRALVTGCAGFIGSHLTESLLDDGVSVIGIDCFNDNYGRSQKLRNLRRVSDWEKFEFAPIDLARGDLSDLVAECDVLYHLAAEPGVRASWGQRFESYVRNNVMATQHLLDAACAQELQRFIYASSSSIYGQAEQLPTSEDVIPRPFSPYGITKLTGEHLCLAYQANYGVPAVLLRYFSVYGPKQRPDMAFTLFCRAALQGERIQVFGDGRQTRDFTFVTDVVQATRAAAAIPDLEGRVYNIGGGARVSLSTAISVLGDLIGKPIAVDHVPRLPGDLRDTGAAIDKARADLHYEPVTDLRNGLSAQVEWVAASRQQVGG